MSIKAKSKIALEIEKIRKIPLPLSRADYRKLTGFSYIDMSPSDESFPKEYRDEMNRVMQEINKEYQAKLARGEVKVPF